MKKIISSILALLMCLSLLQPFGVAVFAEETNIARGKTVLGGGSAPEAVTDGNTSNAVYWDGGTAPSYVVIDLDGFYDITRVNVITYYGDGRNYKYDVDVSDDGLVFTTVSSKTDNKTATKEGTDHVFEATGRYVRIVMKSNSANSSVHLVEVSVYGTPNPDYVAPEKPTVDEKDPGNIAYGKPTRSNSVSSITGAVNDGDNLTCWEGEDYPRYVDVDLMDNYDISSVKLFFRTKTAQTFNLYGSLDGVSFTRIYEEKEFKSTPDTGLVIEFAPETTWRILRVSLTGSSDGIRQKANLAEIRVYGTKSDSKVTPTREKMEFTSYDEWLLEHEHVDLAALKDENGKYDIKDTYTKEDTVKELNGIVTRLLGEEYVSWFIFDVVPGDDPEKDYFKIEDAEGKIKITGEDGVCVAAGLNWYLKYYCGVHIVQETKQVRMPDEIAKVGEPVYKDTKLKLRYAYNYCTLSYTMAFYGYDEWRRELDWLYLNGVNLILDTTATEALWVQYLQNIGYGADDAKNYVCGYAFKAWWLMGNLEGYGGTVSDMWIYDTLEMARINQRSMTVMGARPALQSFVGAMPQSFKKIAKDTLLELGYSDVTAYMAPQGSWAGLLTRPNVLRTDYDGYSYLAQLFYEAQEYIYGQVTDYFCGDVCHEGGIIPEGLVKEEMAARILSELMTYDPDGVWILQRWWDNPIREVLDGFGEYRTTNILVLDLNTAQTTSNFTDTKKYGAAEFGGTAWILSSLDDYGGNEGMHGSLQVMVNNVMRAKNNSVYLRGMGITPEGTQNNPIMYDLYWELVWRDTAPKILDWTTQYVERRYGQSDTNTRQAWRKLLTTVYTSGNADDGGPMRGSISGNPGFGYQGGYYEAKYNLKEYYEAIKLLMASFDLFKDNECYIYDLTDALSTYLSAIATKILRDMSSIAASPKSDDAGVKFENLANKYLDIMLLVDELGTYSKNEMVGTWIGRAYNFMNDDRTMDYDDYSADMMAFNAKCLITAWHSGTLIDYAARRYNGLMYDYYYQSWSEFLSYLVRQVKGKVKCDTQSYAQNSHFKNAWAFINNGEIYRTEVASPDGSGSDRGLVAIFDHITANYQLDNRSNTFVSITADKNSGLSVFEGSLSGVRSGITAGELTDLLTAPEGMTLCIKNGAGKKVDQNDTLFGRYNVELYNGEQRVSALVFSTEGNEVLEALYSLPFGIAEYIIAVTTA